MLPPQKLHTHPLDKCNKNAFKTRLDKVMAQVFQHQCWENCGTLKGWKLQSVGSQLRTALCFVCLLLLPTDWAREGRGQPGVQLLWEDRKLSPLHRGWNKHSSRQTEFIFSQVWFEF